MAISEKAKTILFIGGVSMSVLGVIGMAILGGSADSYVVAWGLMVGCVGFGVLLMLIAAGNDIVDS